MRRLAQSSPPRWLAAVFVCTAALAHHALADEEVAAVEEIQTTTVATPEVKNRGFIFTAPKRVLIDTNETVCLSLHNIPGSGYVHVDILHTDSDEKIASLKHRLKPDKGACMDLYIPQTTQIRGRLHLKAQFDDAFNYTINSIKEIFIDQNPHVVFIETDKPTYKPGQEVKFRVMTVKHNLSPVKGPIQKIWLENPSGVRMAQWLRVPTELGLAQLTFQLSPEPVLGNWVIKVQRSKNQTLETQTFEVKEYVLPKFEVTINPPSYVLADTESITWQICAKYSYGKPVKGKLEVLAEPIVPYWRHHGQELRKVNKKYELNEQDGCANFSVAGKEIGLGSYEIAPDEISVNASVTELGTEVTQSSENKISVNSRALKMKFLPYCSKYFKPGLPYKGKVKVMKPDNTPAEGEEIQLCLKVTQNFDWSRTLVECKNFSSDSSGFIEFVIPPQDINITLLSISATAIKYETTYYSPDMRWRTFMHQPSDSFDAEPWYSPSGSFIEIADWNAKKLECNTRHIVNIYFTVEANNSNINFHYLVKSRGDIVHYGHKLHQFTKRNQPELDEFPNLLGVGNSSSNTFKSMDKFNLKLYLTPKMSPTSYLLVYYVRDDGETVATSHTLKIKKCFANEVQAEWSDSSLYPGSEASFKIKASPESLCAITAVDKSITFLGKQNNINRESVFSRLEQYEIDDNSPPRQTDDMEYCKKKAEEEVTTKTDEDPPEALPTAIPAAIPESSVMVEEKPKPVASEREELDSTVQEEMELRKRRKRRIFFRPPASSKYVDALKAFDDFGVIVMTDLTMETRPCSVWEGEAGAANFRGMAFPRSGAAIPDVVYLSQAMPMAVSLDSVPYGGSNRAPVVEVRSFFPETWLWDLVHTGEDGTAVLATSLPHTITDWIGQATCLSSSTGLGTSTPSNLNAFQPFFLEVTLPYSVKRGETLRMKVSVFNFLSHSLPIKLSLENVSGLEIVGQDSTGYCVGSKNNFVAEFPVKMTELGEVNITVSAQVDELFPEPCGPEILFSRRDVVIKPVLVKPEGFPMDKSYSSFVCSTEKKDSVLYWNLELPSDLVEGSARAEVSAIGDMLGPALENLDGLVQLPMGCGEQNMILFVPNIHVLNYLESTNQVNPVLKAKALINMEKGYQRELIYRHEDGSYSAFGKSDPEGSMWLTAFVVKSFAQARKFIFIDRDDLKISVRWIVKRQMENGCFPFVGKVFHKDLKGGLSGESSSAAFTAYITTALLESGIEMSDSVLSNALYCLAPDEQEPPDIYTLALTTYALSLAGPNQTEAAQNSLKLLLDKATHDKEMMWWSKPGAKSKGMDIEITAYAVLSLVKLGGTDNLIHAFKAVRWISQQRNARGGFVSTQDTVVALEALSKYATIFMNNGNGKNTSLDVSVKAIDYATSFSIDDVNRLLLHRSEIPVLPTGVDVTIAGEGCVVVQVALKYNVKTPTGSDAFDLEVKTKPQKDDCTIQSIEVCTRYKLTDQSSNMAVMEMDMVSGFAPIKETLNKLKDDPSLNLKRWEENNNQINLYFDQLSSTRVCIDFLVQQDTQVENAKPATVKVYDYYQQELSISTDYVFRTECATEKLPVPLVAIAEVERVDEVIKVPAELLASDDQAKEGSKGVLKVNNSDIPEGLNPSFVNVDHDLEFPDGIEGPSPIYTSPQADSSRHHEDRDDCPHCMDTMPDNFAKMFCDSRNAYKIAVRKFLNAKVLMILTPRRRARKLNKQISFTVKRTCTCLPLHKAGSHVIVLNVIEDNFNGNKPHIKIGGSSVVIMVPPGSGQPSVVRSARSSCK
ncbi:alpha-2-macroglobulin-like protein 1 isoform X2 [Ischnura elegans]|uniref:alpha-2-macroglobulin-like protein 1 isoform X2 n=1 Tax=Ischnura elegans TaxID=197161 RepID=UPI001ED8A7C7|nr:alpha-2-macroglobulin-like protein 1 isoform X2 [Ischnura elegans]